MISEAFAVAPHAAGGTRWVRDDRFVPLLTVMAWTLIVLMIVPDDFDYSALVNHVGMPAAGGLFSRLLWLGLLGTGIWVVAWRALLAWMVTRTLNPFLLVFAVLALASVVWSIEPTLTARRCVRLFTILLDSLALVVMGWNPRRLQQLVRPILTLMLAGSIVFGLVCPQLAIHQETSHELAGAWRGLANHKNTFGAIACINLILWLHAWWTRENRFSVALAGTALSAACLVLSRSSTSLMTALFAALFLALLMRSSRRLKRFVPYFVVLLAVALDAYALAILRLVPGTDILLEPVMALTGKDLTFTGRADIWAIIVDHVNLNPVLGTGYGAYWAGPLPGTPSYDFISKLQFYPNSSHNGYLEILNDLGIAGLVCLLGFLVVYLAQALRLMRNDFHQAALYLALFLQQAISNLSETHWLSVLSVSFVITTFATFSLARALLEVRLREYFGEPDCIASPHAGHRELGHVTA